MKYNKSASLALVLILTACGGGDGSTSSSTGGTGGTGGTAGTGGGGTTPALVASCTNCAASGPGSYAGSGVGTWQFENSTNAEASLPVNITGITGQTVTVTYTNVGNSAVPFSPILGNYYQPSELKPQELRNLTPSDNRAADIGKFNTEGFKQALIPRGAQDNQTSFSQVTNSNLAVVGDTKIWNYQLPNSSANASATFTLKQQVTAYDGRVINFWVDNNEYSLTKVTDADISNLASKFATGTTSLYKDVVTLTGPAWGPHNFSNLIPPTGQTLNVVLANLTPDGAPYGFVGYFSSANNFLKTTQASSNEALAVFLDTETIYAYATPTARLQGATDVILTLAHEFTHLINFYQRSVAQPTLAGVFYNFDTWLEEGSSLMVEDILSDKIKSGSNTVRDNRFPLYLLDGKYNCSMIGFNYSNVLACSDYERVSSFMAFLVRKYGVTFHKALVTNFTSTDSVTVMDNLIKAYGGIGFNDELKKFSTVLAIFKPTEAPSGFGFPAITDQGYTLASIYAPNYVTRRVTQAQPSTLNPNGGNYYYEVANVQNSFQKSIVVPPHTNVSIVVK